TAIRAGEIGGARYDAAIVVAVSRSECAILPGVPSPPPPRAPVDLLLALPRPKCVKRLLPQIAALGPARVFLTAAEKVEKDYWGCALLKPGESRALLLDGLAQAGDVVLPEIRLVRRLKPFVQDEIPALYPEGNRFLAHPGEATETDGFRRAAAGAPGVLAVGPEGGWTAFELDLFAETGFRRVSMGPRTLRTDTAVVALAALFAAANR
ncbi:MAG: RNA methyltransferase, partial [Kiritimatiellae bacterium]|nr:RNA methyltransferase [Kiritimatiellia bacterium]